MIEDVEYLLKNCEKDSMPFFVDSSRRHRVFHPTPSEYQVSFPMPFRLVTGFDILDATIPTTMYNVDIYNDTMAISTMQTYMKADPTMSQFDYFAELTDSTIFSTIFEDPAPRTALVIANEADISEFISDEQRVPNTYPGGTHTAFIATRHVVHGVPLEIFLSDRDPEVYYVLFENRKYGLHRNDLSNQQFIDILEDGNCKIKRRGDGTFSLVYFKFYFATETQVTNLTDVVVLPTGAQIVGPNVIARIYNYFKKVEHGNYDITLFRQYLYDQWTDLDIKVEATTPVDRKQGKLQFTSSELVIFNGGKSTIRTNLGFETLPTVEENDKYAFVQVKDNKYVFVSNQRNDKGQWILYPPGLVNLLGERYVILRCREIEDHLLGSYSYMNYTPGIGMFKLASANDVTNLRFDFVSLIRKPFHPIGKVSKLTFRFETANGDLYDFKGVNHQILFMMKFLVPTQKIKFERSVLNPNYDPDFVRYMSKNKTVQYQEASDEEEEFDTQEYYEMYKREMEKYDLVSSEEDGNDTDSSEEPVQLSAPRRR